MTTLNPTSSPNANSSNSQANTISLVSAEASKITNVSLYSGRAVITRSFKLALVDGQNQVIIRGFPRALQNDSVRVEGRGNASIHDVVISKNDPSSNIQAKNAGSSPGLERKQQELQKQIVSIKHARSALDTYLGTFNANNIAFSELGNKFTGHALLARKLDSDILDLEQELAENSKAQKEMLMLFNAEAVQLPWQITIDVWAQVSDQEAEIWVVYVVNHTDWAPSYDIRADTQNSSKNITIHYKASISQDTGESWDGVPLTLETVAPAFDMVSPSLPPWNLAAKAKPEYAPRPYTVPSMHMQDAPIPQTAMFRPSRSSSLEPMFHAFEPPTIAEPQAAMQHRPVIGRRHGYISDSRLHQRTQRYPAA